MRWDKHYSHNHIYFRKSEYQIRWTIYPSIASLLRHRGKYVCIKRYHCPHLAAVMVPMFRCRACCNSWVRVKLTVRISPSELYAKSFVDTAEIISARGVMWKYALKNAYGPLFCSQIFYENWARVSLFKRTTLMSDCFLLTLGENTVMFVSPH